MRNPERYNNTTNRIKITKAVSTVYSQGCTPQEDESLFCWKKFLISAYSNIFDIFRHSTLSSQSVFTYLSTVLFHSYFLKYLLKSDL